MNEMHYVTISLVGAGLFGVGLTVMFLSTGFRAWQKITEGKLQSPVKKHRFSKFFKWSMSHLKAFSDWIESQRPTPPDFSLWETPVPDVVAIRHRNHYLSRRKARVIISDYEDGKSTAIVKSRDTRIALPDRVFTGTPGDETLIEAAKLALAS